MRLNRMFSLSGLLKHSPCKLVNIVKQGTICRHASVRVVLGIETSCDDTGAAVVDEHGLILGESLHSQKEVHLQ